jgi:hypothetical protein
MPANPPARTAAACELAFASAARRAATSGSIGFVPGRRWIRARVTRPV